MGCIHIFSIMYSDLCVSICACVKFCAILLHVDDDVLKTQNGDSPGGPVDKAQGFDPWSGKIPHASEQQSLRAIITEPVRVLQIWKCACLEPMLCHKRSLCSEKPLHG